MGAIRRIYRRLRYGNRSESEIYLDGLRAMGVEIGRGTVAFAPTMTFLDVSRPWMLTIGENVQITKGVTVLTHGYDWAVLKGVSGEILGSAGKVIIGNNVFLGMNCTVLKGVTIGNNVIIGADSLVNKDIPSNCVAAGNPCRVIMSLEEYRQKRQQAQLSEARELVRSYRQRYGKEPDEQALSEFFWLFTKDASDLPGCWREKMELVGNYRDSVKALEGREPLYSSMEEFLRDIDFSDQM